MGPLAEVTIQAYERGTKDGDVLRTREIDDATKAALEKLAGPGTELHARHGVYLDVVSPNVPMLPSLPQWLPLPLDLENFSVRVLDVADVCVSKLKRFNGNDQRDIDAMVTLECLEHAKFADRFRMVIERYRFDGRADLLEGMAARFNQIERNSFLVDCTAFELPEIH